VFCRAYDAVTLWMLGYPNQALQRTHEALTLARELAHPFSLGNALFFAAWVSHFRGKPLTQETRAMTSGRAGVYSLDRGDHSWLGTGCLGRMPGADR
jgi:hypothetical protein